jgi:hypothetical protein
MVFNQFNLEDLLVQERFQAIKPRGILPFAWPSRLTQKLRLGIKIGSSIQDVSIDKVQKHSEIQNETGTIRYFVQVKVYGNSK